MDTDELWGSYKKDGNQQSRNQLILHYQDLVEQIARKVGAKLPQHVETADLKTYGNFGLIDAITKYDPNRGIKFEIYAARRIRGQMIDELRKIDWVPRAVHTQTRNIQVARAELETLLQRDPADQEIADHLGLTTGQLAGAQSEERYVTIDTLEELTASGGETAPWVTQLQDHSGDSASGYEVSATRDLLANAVSSLPEEESRMLTLFYFEGLKSGDVATLMELTSSRTHQLHTRALTQIAERLSAA